MPESHRSGEESLSRGDVLDRMIGHRVMGPEWLDRALRSESPDRWRLAFAELLDSVGLLPNESSDA